MIASKSLLKRLRAFPKTYFSINDIKKIYHGSPQSLRVILSRYVKQGMLQKIMRGYFTFDLLVVDWEEFACTIKKPSYISLESALYHYGFIDQIPETLTLVTTGKSGTIACQGKILEYAHINPKLYFGYEIVKNAFIGKKEKTLLDEIYLMSLKKRTLGLQSKWLKIIDTGLFYRWLEKYPLYTKRFIKKSLR